MRYFRQGGILYGLVYMVWRGSVSLESRLATSFYRTVLKAENNVSIGAGTYISHPRSVRFGHNCSIGRHVCLTTEVPTGSLTLGNNVQLSDYVQIDFSGGVTIGDNVLVSAGTVIYTHDHGYDPRSVPSLSELSVDQDVWVGLDVVILSDVRHIGRSAVIGARSVVTRDVGDFVIVAGNPARVIRVLEPDHGDEYRGT